MTSNSTSTGPARGGLWRDGIGKVAVRCAQLLLIAAALVVVALVVIRLRFVVVPVLIAVVVASATWPLVRLLRRRGLSDALAALMTVLACLLGVAALGFIVVNGVYGEWGELERGAREGLVELEQGVVSTLPIDRSQFADLRSDLIGEPAQEEVRQQAASGAVLAAEVISAFVLMFVILFFLLKDGTSIWGQVQRHVVPGSQRERVQRIGEKSVIVLGAFVRGTTIVALVDAVVIGVALALLGVPLVLPLAVVVFMGAYVPLVGATAAGALAALVALVSQGPLIALAVVGVVVFVNQLEGDFLAPVVLGNAVSLHPLAILLSLASGFIAAGVIGALLAVPLLAVVWTVITAWDEPEPVPEPEMELETDP